MTTSKLAARVGISASALNRLTQAGLIEPSIRRSRTAGSAALWSEDDAKALQAMLAAQETLARLGRCRVPALRLRALGGQGLLAVGVTAGAVVRIAPTSTVAQLLRTLGGAFAILPQR